MRGNWVVEKGGGGGKGRGNGIGGEMWWVSVGVEEDEEHGRHIQFRSAHLHPTLGRPECTQDPQRVQRKYCRELYGQWHTGQE